MYNSSTVPCINFVCGEAVLWYSFIAYHRKTCYCEQKALYADCISVHCVSVYITLCVHTDDDVTGVADGEERGGQDQHEVYHICQLHCQGHQKIGSNQ